MAGEELAVRHLMLRMRPVHRALRAAVMRQAAAAARLERPDLTALCVTDNHVLDLLEKTDQLISGETTPLEPNLTSLAGEESAMEVQFRAVADELGYALPLDRCTAELKLDPFELTSLLVCVAPEFDPSYERIFAYILDDLNRRHPCVELLCNLASGSLPERLLRRRMIGPYGRLRRCGLLKVFGETASEARTQLGTAPGVLEFLIGANNDAVGLWRDPAEVDLAAAMQSVPESLRPQLTRIGRAIGDRAVAVVGIWGGATCEPLAAAALVARTANRPLRSLPLEAATMDTPGAMDEITHAVHTASVLGAALQVPVDLLHDVKRRDVSDRLARILTASDTPVILTGAEPWRPTCLLAARSYVERELVRPSLSLRESMWRDALPEADQDRVQGLAGRFHMSQQEITAVARVARTQSNLAGNGKPANVDDSLDAACAAVARKTGGRFVGVVKPRRGPADLILPADLHQQVLEIAGFSRVLPLVAETWGFGRLATGGSGIKSLFTGDPGTGKTLTAEVIAGLLAVPLLKINIGQTVSKWVGETEKNLDEAFQEAKSSHAVLFFDEADALFGKRGEVRHGVDRYANTEVSHLLQRLEDHDGLVILASNLVDNIDPAFTRRFHIIIHFPRPADSERRRIWRIAFPSESPLAANVDLDAMARLDMTGAGIVGSARTAALLAADEGAPEITMSHIVRGIARQYRREARILTTAELGSYARLL